MSGGIHFPQGRLAAGNLGAMFGIIGATDTVQFTATAPSIAEARAVIEPQVPQGYEIISAQPTMAKQSQDVTVTAIARATQTQEIEGASLDALRAATPDGWRLMSVRT